MWAYIIRRVLATIPVMLVVAVVVFLLLRLSPGDPAASIAGDIHPLFFLTRERALGIVCS